MTSSGDVYVAVLPPLRVFNDLIMVADGRAAISAALDVDDDVTIVSQSGGVVGNAPLHSGGTVVNRRLTPGG